MSAANGSMPLNSHGQGASDILLNPAAPEEKGFDPIYSKNKIKQKTFNYIRGLCKKSADLVGIICTLV